GTSTSARATARRWVTGLAPTSIMRTSPMRCEVYGPRQRSGEAGVPREVAELVADPAPDVVLADVRADPLDHPAALAERHLGGRVDGVRLVLDGGWGYADCVFVQLLVSAGVLRQDQHAVSGVHQRSLLGDQVHAVEDR